jgi:hypothetical protein
MRVSSTFNALAGPRLYNTLILGETSGLSDPFDVPKRGVFDIPVKKAWLQKANDKMKTQGKERDLGYVRHVFFGGYFNFNQGPKYISPAEKGRLLKSVKSIRLGSSSTSRDFDHSHTSEIIARFTNIEKLVFSGNSVLAQASLDRLPATCKTGVVIIEPHLGCFPPIDWLFRSLQTIVYMFLGTEKSYGSGLVTHLASVLIAASPKKGSLKRIIMVNPPTLRFPGLAETTIRDYIARGLRAKHDADQTIPSQEAQTSPTTSPLQYPK